MPLKTLSGKHADLRKGHGGRDNDPDFGSRMRGSGELADLLARRFNVACKRIGFDSERRNRALDTTRCRVPGRARQMPLF